MLSLCQPTFGLFHFRRMQPCRRGWTDLPTQKKYSTARFIQVLWRDRFRVVFSKPTLLLCFHNPQTAKGNKLLQGILWDWIWALHKLLFFNQVNQFKVKEEVKEAGTPIFLQNSVAKGHSFNKWLIDSVPFLHKEQVVSYCTSLSAMTPLTSTLL